MRFLFCLNEYEIKYSNYLFKNKNFEISGRERRERNLSIHQPYGEKQADKWCGKGGVGGKKLDTEDIKYVNQVRVNGTRYGIKYM